MAKIKIIEFPEVTLSGKDIVINISDNKNGQMGKLSISQGNIGWTPVNCQYERTISWKRFCELMTNETEGE